MPILIYLRFISPYTHIFPMDIVPSLNSTYCDQLSYEQQQAYDFLLSFHISQEKHEHDLKVERHRFAEDFVDDLLTNGVLLNKGVKENPDLINSRIERRTREERWKRFFDSSVNSVLSRKAFTQDDGLINFRVIQSNLEGSSWAWSSRAAYWWNKSRGGLPRCLKLAGPSRKFRGNRILAHRQFGDWGVRTRPKKRIKRHPSKRTGRFLRTWEHRFKKRIKKNATVLKNSNTVKQKKNLLFNRLKETNTIKCVQYNTAISALTNFPLPDLTNGFTEIEENGFTEIEEGKRTELRLGLLQESDDGNKCLKPIVDKSLQKSGRIVQPSISETKNSFFNWTVRAFNKIFQKDQILNKPENSEFGEINIAELYKIQQKLRKDQKDKITQVFTAVPELLSSQKIGKKSFDTKTNIVTPKEFHTRRGFIGTPT